MLSFSDSLKKFKEAESLSPEMVAMSLDDKNNDIVLTSNDTQDTSWTRIDRYFWYDDYYDEDISIIDDQKNIIVNEKQINLTQETNSQFVPFQMNRYQDGFDLVTTNLLIHFVNKNGNENFATPVNVSYSSDKIRFAWLINKDATAVAGDLTFEIHAVGTNSKGDEYIWKTCPNGKFNILKSLEGDGIIEPDSTWITSFLRQVNEKVAEAQASVQEAKAIISTAQDAVNEANNAAQQAQGVVDNAKTELQNSLKDSLADILSKYYTQQEVDSLLSDIDLTEVYDAINNIDGLANFRTSYNSETRELTFYNGQSIIKTEILNSNPTAEWISANDEKTDNKISEAISPIQSDLETIHDDIDGLPQTLATNYYNKEVIDEFLEDKADKSSVNNLNQKLSTVESTSNTNKSNIEILGTKISDMETVIGEIDTAPSLAYDIDYNDPEIGENVFRFYEIQNEGDPEKEIKTIKKQFTIVGGQGGGTTSSVLKIEYVTMSPVIVTVSDKVLIKFNFYGTDSSGDIVPEGTATWKVGNSIVATSTAISGENTFDISDYISVGTQKVLLTITDDAGSLVTKSWTVQKIDVRLESSFNDKLTYPLGDISFDYTPYGAISKDIHFILDGNEIGMVSTASSGIPMSYTLPSQPHGAHLVDVYMTALINNSTIESNHIIKDVIWYDSTSDSPVISCVQQNITVKQYDTTNIVYSVYDPKTENPKVTLSIDGEIVSTLTLDSNTQTWQYKPTEEGEHTLTITCGDTLKTLVVTVEKLNIDISPITAGLAFDFNPIGRSNNDVDRLWYDGNVSMTVSDNFDWVNGGYQIDENGDQYFCVKAGTTAVINYKLFADDAKRNGKEFKLVFKTTNVRKANATFLSCQTATTGLFGIGLQMNVHEAYVNANTDTLYLPYSEEDIIEFEFNINKNTDSIPMVLGYEDGVPFRPMIYTSDSSFTQISPEPITIGSDDCDVLIYRMKAYENSLTDFGVLNNFIADARNADDMINRYNRSQIYNENNSLIAETLAEKCPWLRIIKLEAPHFTNNKSDKVKESIIEMIYKNGDSLLDNWRAVNAGHSGQGTTSNEYGQAGRNLDFIMNYSDTEIILGDGITKAENGKISLTRNSVPVNYLNFKINVASSECENNAILQKRYNRYLPYQMPAQKRDPRVKNSMEFFNCVVFIKESDSDVSTHREFNDCEWHFYGIGNVGDSKKTDNTRVNDSNDPKEFVVEIMDNTLPNSTFSGTPEALAALDDDQFDEKGTYGFRYEMNGITNEQRQTNMQVWRNFYRFVVTSSDTEFKENLKNWFVVDSALYFYLFTERYTMIDNRGKNTFWHWSKVYITQEEANTLGTEAQYYTIDNDAAQINDGYRFELWDYDNDTSLGINNSGELTMTYGKEDTDYRTNGDPNSGYIFNAATSTFFCKIRDLFADELNAMFVNRESQNCWSAISLINEFDEAQAEFPEELWRLHFQRVYFRTYEEGTERFVKEMMNGRKKYHRRQFERDQEKYMATKHYGTTATSDQIMFRCNTPTDNVVVSPNYTLHLTPYSDMYLSVMFGATYKTQVRAEAGKQYDIECPFTTMDDTAVLIYCASRIQAVGDISACYIHDNDFSKASRLQELIIGNTTEGYQNTFLTNLGIGNNTLLKKLDIQNTPNLAQALNLSACGNLEELYAHGSGLTGVSFADGGKIRIAELPAITSITMKNLTYLTGLNISDFNNLSTLVIENCNTVNIKEFFDEAPNINRVRITGINWNIENTDILERIYKMYGIDKNGYNIPQSVLSGTVHVPVIREQKLVDYHNAWSDLEITYNTLINQFVVTFINDDGTILDVQYVDKGENPVDPITRKDNPIATPTKESSVSIDYTFAGWDTTFVAVFAPMTITATYTESLRKYTVKYVNRGIVLQESISEYGTTVFYTGDVPSYTAEESAYKYYLFDRWDQSGYVNGDKIINALYDVCEYTSGYFDGKGISSLRPVEIYAMGKLGIESQHVDIKDSISFELGHDYSYDDIEEEILISEQTDFTGSNYIDTGVSIFDEDRDFVIAIDYKFSSGNATNAVLAQCYQNNGANGFRLWYNNGPKLVWGTSSITPSSVNAREMLVIRHVKGENVLHIYTSNLSGDNVVYNELPRTRSTITNATLVFGCAKADDGAYEDYGKGTIYWSKVWFADLGNDACKNLATWTHEKRTFEMCGFKRYYLSDNPSKRCSMTFLDSHLLSRNMILNDSSTNTDAWKSGKLNARLNSRLYNAIPVSWKQLIKQVQISTSVGNKSAEISTSDCYIAIPAVIEVDPTMTNEPYVYEGTSIPFFTTNQSRICAYDDGTSGSYQLRSPNYSYSSYVYRVDENGGLYGYYYPYDECGIRIMFSI